MKSLFIVAFIFCCSQLFAKDYSYFVTDDRRVFLQETNADGSYVIRTNKIEEAKKDKYSRPAAQDPEGNWGLVTNGIQASVRFEKNTFATTDLIPVLIIVRNTGEKWHVFYSVHGVASDIKVVNPEQKQLERKDLAPPDTQLGKIQRATVDHHGDALYPGLQVKRNVNLQDFYDFSLPGKYVVSVKFQTYADHGADRAYVQSSNAVITITNSRAGLTNAPPPKTQK